MIQSCSTHVHDRVQAAAKLVNSHKIKHPRTWWVSIRTLAQASHHGRLWLCKFPLKWTNPNQWSTSVQWQRSTSQSLQAMNWLLEAWHLISLIISTHLYINVFRGHEAIQPLLKSSHIPWTDVSFPSLPPSFLSIKTRRNLFFFIFLIFSFFWSVGYHLCNFIIVK